jgi:Domain of unknown function (DUF362)/Secretion system C-terminal sorting domain
MHHAVTKYSRFYLPFIGLIALVWIALRVIPKPSRASYPCMRAAFPVASGFLAYLASIGLSALVYLKAKTWYRRKKYVFAFLGLAIGLVIPLLMQGNIQFLKANTAPDVQAVNAPIGTPKGIFPGRVVWAHNANAVVQSCVSDSANHAYFMPENNHQPVIDSMLSSAIHSLTGQTSDAASWNAIFQYHNTLRGKGAVNYAAGEKVFIKINATSSWDGNFNSDLTQKVYSSTSPHLVKNQYYGISETSPEIVLSVLRQLVNVVGVADSDIYIGDPMKHIYQNSYNIWHTEFPHAHYLDCTSSYASLGREPVVKSTTAFVHYSDKGTVLKNGGTTGNPFYTDTLYNIFEKAEYVLNIPMMKGHEYAGVSMFAKNHFGSNTQSSAAHLHNGLVATSGNAVAVRTGYHLYRVQVDLMGDSLLSGKNLFYLMDALWSTNFELNKPVKWKMSPFCNQYTASMFASFDPVAIESVGFDFISGEFTNSSEPVQMSGVDDYLHQAADTTNWPSGISYDPNGTGVHLKSLGVHEHWNDTLNKEYSRNLNSGAGIELIKAPTIIPTGVPASKNSIASSFKLYANYPNPFNPSTRISYDIPALSHVTLNIFDMLGRNVMTVVDQVRSPGTYTETVNCSRLASGVYFYKLQAHPLSGQTGDLSAARKFVLTK